MRADRYYDTVDADRARKSTKRSSCAFPRTRVLFVEIHLVVEILTVDRSAVHSFSTAAATSA